MECTMSKKDQTSRKWTWVTFSLVIIAGVVVILLALWTLCIISDYLGHPPNDTNVNPNYAYSYNLVNNGTIDKIIIKSNFTFYFRNDVRYIETTGNTIEVKLWGKYLIPTVEFQKDDTLLNVKIDIQSFASNDFGAPFASEYIYLPKNWTCTIISNNENGNTIVDNKSWNYLANGK
jgi:hypothetical protein